MLFKEIKLQNFRNYEEESVLFNENINIFLGDNAQGKTNLLESLFIMGLGKSFRTNKDHEMIGFNKEFSRATATVCDDQGESSEETEIEICYKKEGKIIKVDGLKLSRSMDLLEKVYVVIFSPEDLKIVKDGPDNRRRFLDRELCQIKPVYYSNLANYKRVLKQRNVLLRNGNVNKTLLATFDGALVDYGLRLTDDRFLFVKRLEEISSDIHQKISEGKERLNLSYESCLPAQSEGKSAEERRELFLKLLQDNLQKDTARGYTGEGPHKDDINIEINGFDIRQFGSQGQQRTAALSMKLAEIVLIRQETQEKAILLLDDVLSELDSRRQRFLIEAMKDVQVFITATDIDDKMLELLPKGWVFNVKGGSVKRLT
jgi:DNA replication and repair protein RecF